MSDEVRREAQAAVVELLAAALLAVAEDRVHERTATPAPAVDPNPGAPGRPQEQERGR